MSRLGFTRPSNGAPSSCPIHATTAPSDSTSRTRHVSSSFSGTKRLIVRPCMPVPGAWNEGSYR